MSMARIIIYNDYLNAGSDPSHVLQSLDYIAKREGVEKNGMEERLSDMKRQLNPATASRQVTERQRVLINALLEEYPDLKEDIPYEEYKKDQNMYTASRFIAELAERLEELTMGNEIYANYIAERPGVDKDVDQEHGLFDEGGAADLQAIRSELQQHSGNVWRSIISLRRNDAEEFDRDDQESWRSLLQQHVPSLAKGMGIPIEHFRWCAAFHDESYHPHVHMMYWSIKEGEGFCSKQTLHDFKSGLVNDIFSNELWLYREFKQAKRQELEERFLLKESDPLEKKNDACYKACMKQVPAQIVEDMERLSTLLPDSGSKAYMYQSRDIKQEIDLIVAKILSEESIKPIFHEYMCSQRELAAFYMSDDSKAMKAYMDQTLERLIHPGKKDRKVLHNMVLQQAHQIKEQRFIARLKLEPMLQDIIERMKTKQISAEEIRDPKRVAKSIYRIYGILGRPAEEALEAAAAVIRDEEKRMELYLDIKSDDTLRHMTRADWKLLKDTYLSKAEQETQTDVRADHTLHSCAKLLHGMLSFMTIETRQNTQEAARLHNAILRDERMIRMSKWKREARTT